MAGAGQAWRGWVHVAWRGPHVWRQLQGPHRCASGSHVSRRTPLCSPPGTHLAPPAPAAPPARARRGPAPAAARGTRSRRCRRPPPPPAAGCARSPAARPPTARSPRLKAARRAGWAAAPAPAAGCCQRCALRADGPCRRLRRCCCGGRPPTRGGCRHAAGSGRCLSTRAGAAGRLEAPGVGRAERHHRRAAAARAAAARCLGWSWRPMAAAVKAQPTQKGWGPLQRAAGWMLRRRERCRQAAAAAQRRWQAALVVQRRWSLSCPRHLCRPSGSRMEAVGSAVR